MTQAWVALYTQEPWMLSPPSELLGTAGGNKKEREGKKEKFMVGKGKFFRWKLPVKVRTPRGQELRWLEKWVLVQPVTDSLPLLPSRPSIRVASPHPDSYLDIEWWHFKMTRGKIRS